MNNLSTHIVTYTNLQSTSSIEACKFVKINTKSNEIEQTYMLEWYHNMLSQSKAI